MHTKTAHLFWCKLWTSSWTNEESALHGRKTTTGCIPMPWHFLSNHREGSIPACGLDTPVDWPTQIRRGRTEKDQCHCELACVLAAWTCGWRTGDRTCRRRSEPCSAGSCAPAASRWNLPPLGIGNTQRDPENGIIDENLSLSSKRLKGHHMYWKNGCHYQNHHETLTGSKLKEKCSADGMLLLWTMMRKSITNCQTHFQIIF